MNNPFETVLADFKAKEAPEAVLAVGDDPNLIRVVLAWPNILIEKKTKQPKLSEGFSDVEKWDWLWQCVEYTKWELGKAVGTSFSLDKEVSVLIANRILYPDGTVHSYVTRYLRDRVVKLFEAKPRTLSRAASK